MGVNYRKPFTKTDAHQKESIPEPSDICLHLAVGEVALPEIFTRELRVAGSVSLVSQLQESPP